MFNGVSKCQVPHSVGVRPGVGGSVKTVRIVVRALPLAYAAWIDFAGGIFPGVRRRRERREAEAEMAAPDQIENPNLDTGAPALQS
jgi:hypothetical protein